MDGQQVKPLADERALVVQAQAGDHEAFVVLMERHLKEVFNLCLRYLGHRQDAEDMTQETFVRAYQHLWAFDPERPFRNWVMTIAIRLCIDRLRRRRPQQPLEHPEYDEAWLADPAPSPEDMALRYEQVQRIQRLIQRLPPLERALVVLHYWEGYRYEELAQALQLSVSAVKSRLFRARRKLLTYWMEEEAS